MLSKPERVNLTASQIDRANGLTWYHALNFGDYQTIGRIAPPMPPNVTLFGVMEFLSKIDVQGMRCLDVGPAHGLISFGLALKGASVSAVNIGAAKPPQFLLAEEIYGVSIDYRCPVSLEKTPEIFEPATFDLIVCAGVMYHLLNPADVFFRLRPLLKRNGLLVMETVYAPAQKAPVLVLNSESKSFPQPTTYFLASDSALVGMAKLSCFDVLATREQTPARFTLLGRATMPNEVRDRNPFCESMHDVGFEDPMFKISDFENAPASSIRYTGPKGHARIKVRRVKPDFPSHPNEIINPLGKREDKAGLWDAGKEKDPNRVKATQIARVPDEAPAPAEPKPAIDTDSLVRTDEFFQKYRSLIGNKVLYETQLHDPISVEHEADEESFGKILSHIQQVWSRLGEEEPHWSVVSVADFKSDKIDETLQKFYESGRSEVANLLRLLKRVGREISLGSRALEYGCGVGRVTRWLADHFESVLGVDISAAHLAHAKQYFETENIHNVDLFHLRELGDLKSLKPVDFIYSKIVLHHNPPPVIARTLDILCSKLNPGGLAVLQIPTYAKGYRFSVSEYLEKMGSIDVMEMHVLPQPIVYGILGSNACMPLEVSRDHLVTTVDFVSTTFVFQKAS